MNIDTEKMRVAVLAECERICPNDEDTFEVTINGLDCTITGRHHHGISGFDIRETGFFKRRIYQIRSSDDGSWWHLYYIFLGLSERDAVAEKQKTNDYLVERIDKAEWKVAELKASLNTAQQMYTDLLVGTTDAIAAKDAELKRLRSGIQKVADHLWVREPRNMSWLELRDQVSILHGLLSPAPVTEGEDYQKEDQFIFSFGERLKATHQGFEGCSDQWYRVARTAIEIYKNEDQE